MIIFWAAMISQVIAQCSFVVLQAFVGSQEQSLEEYFTVWYVLQRLVAPSIAPISFIYVYRDASAAPSNSEDTTIDATEFSKGDDDNDDSQIDS